MNVLRVYSGTVEGWLTLTNRTPSKFRHIMCFQHEASQRNDPLTKTSLSVAELNSQVSRVKRAISFVCTSLFKALSCGLVWSILSVCCVSMNKGKRSNISKDILDFLAVSVLSFYLYLKVRNLIMVTKLCYEPLTWHEIVFQHV